MKKLFFLLSVSIFFLSSCGKNSNDDMPPNPDNPDTPGNQYTAKLSRVTKYNHEDTIKFISAHTYGDHGYVTKIHVTSEKNGVNDGDILIHEFEYNSDKQLILNKSYKADDNGVLYHDSTTEFTYNNQGYIISALRENIEDNGGATYEYIYDNNGKMVKSISKYIEDNGSSTTYIFIFEYDQNGNMTKFYPEGKPDGFHAYGYDDKKNPMRTMFPKMFLLTGYLDLSNTGRNNQTTHEIPLNHIYFYSEYTYNDKGYPILLKRFKKNGKLVIIEKYEYE